MKNLVIRHRGETIRLRLTLWEGKRDASPRRDLRDATLHDATVPTPWHVFPTPEMTIVDARGGVVELVWSAAQSAALPEGKALSFRLGVHFPNGDTDVVGDIRIKML